MAGPDQSGWETVSDPREAAAALSAGASQGGAPVTLRGDAYRRMLTPERAAVAQAIVENRYPVPTGPAMRSPQVYQAFQDANMIDPTVDAANYPARVKMQEELAKGDPKSAGGQLQAFERMLLHGATVLRKGHALGNFDSGLAAPLNYGLSAGRAIVQSPAQATFNEAVTNYAPEAQKAISGVAGGVHERTGRAAAFGSSVSGSALAGGLQSDAQQAWDAMSSVNDRYHRLMGKDIKDRISPEALAAYNEIMAGGYDQAGKPLHPAEGWTPIPLPNGSTPSGPTPPPLAIPGATPPSGGGPAAPGGTPPSGPTPPPAGPSGAPLTGVTANGTLDQSIATGDTTTVPDPTKLGAAKQLEAMYADRSIPDAQIMQFAQTLNANPASVAATLEFRKKYPNWTNFSGVATPLAVKTVPIGPVARVLGAAANTAPGAAVVGAGNSVTFGAAPKVIAGLDAVGQQIGGDQRSLGQAYQDNLDSTEQKMGLLQQAHPGATLAGNVAGYLGAEGLVKAGGKGLLALSPRLGSTVAGLADANNVSNGALAYRAALPAATDATVGGLTGLGSSDSLADIPGNIVENGALAAAGGVLGRGAIKGAAAVASPVANAAVQRLSDAGVTMTPGQILGAGGGIVGRAIKGTEDRLAGFPVIGDAINNTRRAGVEDFNKAAINDALTPIGGAATGVGHEGIAAARQQVSDAYTDALGQMKAIPDPQGLGEISAAAQRVTGMAPDQQSAFEDIMANDVRPYLRANGGQQIDSDSLQAIKQGLDKEIARRGPNSSPQDQALGDRLGEVRDAFMSMAARTDPTGAQAFAQADAAHALLSRVEGAAAKSKDGVFTPNQFRQAVTQRGYGTTTRNVAAGNAPMQQLATDASTILPSTVPDSGTAGRAALGGLLGQLAAPAAGGAVGGAGGYLNGGQGGAAAGALAGGLLLSRPGAKVLQYGLAGSRGQLSNTLGDWLRANSQLGGAVGAPALLPGVSYNAQ